MIAVDTADLAIHPPIPIAPGASESGRLGWVIAHIDSSLHRVVHTLLRHNDVPVLRFQYERRRPRKKPQELEYFPSYAFVQLDLADWRLVAWLNGLPGVIRVLGAPCPVPLTEAELALLLEACPRKPEPPSPAKLKRGARLRVVRDGYYSGQTGELLRHRRDRVWLQLQMFGRWTVASMPLADVELVG